MGAETYRPSDLVHHALVDVGAAVASREATAWRVAIERDRQHWRDTYSLHAMKVLALAILSGDDERSEAAALWIVEPDVAMERALAAVTGGSL